MEPVTTSALISGASSLLGGIFGRKSEKKAQAANLKHQNYWNQQSLDFANKQFSQAIQTRVADAKSAGIHPLYALGAPGAGSPSFQTSPTQSGSGLGQGIANAGRAIAAGVRGRRTPEEQAIHRANLAQIEANAASNAAQADYYRSLAAKTQQDTMHTALGRTIEPGSGAPVPVAMAAAGKGKKRPAAARSKADFPSVSVESPFGGVHKGFHPDAGMDELGQLMMAWKMWQSGINNVVDDTMWRLWDTPKGRTGKALVRDQMKKLRQKQRRPGYLDRAGFFRPQPRWKR